MDYERPESLILYLDDQLLAANKPAGLPTLVDGYHPEAPYLAGVLRAAYAPLWVVHRLDRQTSGAIVFARSAAVHRHLNMQFEKRQALKTYHALVQGVPEWERLSITLPLRPNGDRRHRTVVDPQNGKPAHTDLLVLERFKGYCLLQAVPHTGRAHQIRAHLAAAGFPVASDTLYGAALLPALPRLGLHAYRLELRHPETEQEMVLEAPYAEDFDHMMTLCRVVTSNEKNLKRKGK